MNTLINQDYENMLNHEISYFGYIVDKSNYDLLYVNHALMSELSQAVPDLHEYQSKKCYQALHGKTQPCKHCNLHKIKSGEKNHTHYHNKTHKLWFKVMESVVNKDGKELFCRNSFNITDEIKEIGDLKEVIAQNKVVISCAETLLNKTSFDISITKLLEVICDYFGGEYACLFERDYKNSVSNVTYKYHIKDTSLIPLEYTTPFKISPDDEWTKFLSKQSYAYLQSADHLDETLENSSYCKRFLKSDRNNLLVVSLKDNDDVLGAIEIDNITKNTHNVHLVSTISAFIITILHIKNSTNVLQNNIVDLENKNQLNSTILECVKTLVYDDNIDLSLGKLLEIICNYFGANVTNILYKDAHLEMLVCDYAYTNDPNIKDAKIRNFPAKNLIKLYSNFETDGVAYISSVREMTDFLQDNFEVEYESFVRRNIKSILCAPLYQNREIVGFIGVQNPTKNLTELHLVKTICAFVVNHIRKNELLVKLERLSYNDSLTNTYNRNFYNNYIEEFNLTSHMNIGVMFADVNGLKKANDNFGHELGDDLIKGSANFLKKNFSGLIFRIGGDEFVCIIENVTSEKFEFIVNDIDDKLNSFNELHISIGKAWLPEVDDIEHLIGFADDDMYARKKEHYQKSSTDERSIKQYLLDLKKSIHELKSFS